MKKTLITLVVLTAILLATCASQTSAELYPTTFIVINVSWGDNTVTFMDFNGFTWTIEGSEDWVVGDMASAVMYDNDTILVMDDIILCVHYEGWLEGWMELAQNCHIIDQKLHTVTKRPKGLFYCFSIIKKNN